MADGIEHLVHELIYSQIGTISLNAEVGDATTWSGDSATKADVSVSDGTNLDIDLTSWAGNWDIVSTQTTYTATRIRVKITSGTDTAVFALSSSATFDDNYTLRLTAPITFTLA